MKVDSLHVGNCLSELFDFSVCQLYGYLCCKLVMSKVLCCLVAKSASSSSAEISIGLTLFGKTHTLVRNLYLLMG